tara:strand:- start:3495 stop:3812 length:318 start_codon:yes stop_codon:yes gene_type:complete
VSDIATEHAFLARQLFLGLTAVIDVATASAGAAQAQPLSYLFNNNVHGSAPGSVKGFEGIVATLAHRVYRQSHRIVSGQGLLQRSLLFRAGDMQIQLPTEQQCGQ